MRETEPVKTEPYVMGCPKCGSVLTVVNAGYVMTKEPCDNCEGFIADATGELGNGRMNDTLGWCGCGNPEEVDKLMLHYLDSAKWLDDKFPRINNDADRLCAYIADDLGWTEHGGGVGGAWLTDAGREARANLTEAVAAAQS